MVLAAIFSLLPLVLAFVYSFAEIAPLSGRISWVGLANYTQMLTDATFYRSLVNTVIFTVLVVPVSMGIGLALAVLLNSVMPARKLFRTIIYLPLVISGVAVGLIGTFFFNETIGVVNKLLATVSLPGVPWQSAGVPAFASVIIVTLWIRVGFTMIIYLAGLQAVPVELQEAAQVEGADGWQRFRHITFPLLGPSTFFLLVMSVIYSFQVFDIVFVLTGGGPRFPDAGSNIGATDLLITVVYKTAFSGVGRDYGLASALSIVIFLIVATISAISFRQTKALEEIDK